jgi:hypothetical protein
LELPGGKREDFGPGGLAQKIARPLTAAAGTSVIEGVAPLPPEEAKVAGIVPTPLTIPRGNAVADLREQLGLEERLKKLYEGNMPQPGVGEPGWVQARGTPPPEPSGITLEELRGTLMPPRPSTEGLPGSPAAARYAEMSEADKAALKSKDAAGQARMDAEAAAQHRRSFVEAGTIGPGGKFQETTPAYDAKIQALMDAMRTPVTGDAKIAMGEATSTGPFVKEGYLTPPTKREAAPEPPVALTARERLQTMMSLGEPTQTFRPVGALTGAKKAQDAGTGPISFSDQYGQGRGMANYEAVVGASNRRLQDQAESNRNFTQPVVAELPPGEQAVRTPESPGDSAAVEATAAVGKTLGEKLDTLVAALATITSDGLSLPANLAKDMGTEIGKSLAGETLTVAFDGTQTVTLESADLTKLSNSLSVAGTGADVLGAVSAIGVRLTKVESVVAPEEGDINSRLAAVQKTHDNELTALGKKLTDKHDADKKATDARIITLTDKVNTNTANVGVALTRGK